MLMSVWSATVGAIMAVPIPTVATCAPVSRVTRSTDTTSTAAMVSADLKDYLIVTRLKDLRRKQDFEYGTNG